ncbi:hypothetical protein [Dyella acidisoli]|nr:hypothetical protein [Dyella acidisoli]
MAGNVEALEYVLIVAVVLNVFVSVAVAISGCYSARQKISQIVIIWLLPILGAVLFGLFLVSQSGSGAGIGCRSEVEDDPQTWSALLDKDHPSQK